MAMWTEKSLTETRIMSSHFMTGASGSAWMQKELVKSIPSANAQINKTYAYISPTGTGITLWSESNPASSGAGTDFKINLALSSVAVSTHTEQTDTTPDTNPETTPDPDDTTDTTPPSALWSTPAEPDVTVSAPDPKWQTEYVEGPQLLIDNSGNRIIYLSQSEPNPDIKIPFNAKNTLKLSTSAGSWEDLLSGPAALALADLTPPILFEQLQIAHSTNALIGLLRVANEFYIAHYDPSNGWSKSLVPDTNPQEHAPKLHVDNLGNATVIKQIENPDKTKAVVAMYYLTKDGLTQNLQPTGSTFTTSSMNNLLTHDTSSTTDGTVHIGWIDANRLHTAKYPPGETWQHNADTLDIGPFDPTKTSYSVTYGGQEIIILNYTYTDNNRQKHQLKASVRNTNSGTWPMLTNISNISDTQIIGPLVVNSDEKNFMLVWQQQMMMTMNGLTVPVNQFHTAFFDASTTTWSAPTMIGSDTHGQQSTVSIVMHDDSTATAAWIDTSIGGQTTTSVYASSFSAASGWGDSHLLASYAGGTEGVVSQTHVTHHNDTATTMIVWDNRHLSSHEHFIWTSKKN